MPIGNVRVVIKSGYESTIDTIRTVGYDRYTYRKKFGNKIINADVYDAIDVIVSESKKKGANGVIRLKTQCTNDIISSNGNRAATFIVSGMTIKRL